MNSEERKARFIELLKELIDESDGIQSKLADKLQISSARLSSWLQRKIDPANLETGIFERIAQIKGCSVDELAKILQFSTIQDFPSNKFKDLILEFLSNQTQEQLGFSLGVKQGAISNWINPEKNIDPSKISAATMFAIAQKKGWKFDDLLIYLGLKAEQQKQKYPINLINPTVCIILEKEDLAIASNYASNLVLHLNLKPENIKVTTTIPNLPESIADIDILIFDISTSESASIALIEDIEFDRDIIVFIDADLPVEVRSNLESKVTDVVVKPIDWQKLKDKAYFS